MAAKSSGLGQMPLTLFLLTAGVIVYLKLRRAALGIDPHPGEGRPVNLRPTVHVPATAPRPGEPGFPKMENLP